MRKLSVAFLSLLLSLTVIGFLSTPVFTAETDEHPWDIDGGSGSGGDQGHGGSSTDTTDGPTGDDAAALTYFVVDGGTSTGFNVWVQISFKVTSWYFDWTTNTTVDAPAAAATGVVQTTSAR